MHAAGGTRWKLGPDGRKARVEILIHWHARRHTTTRTRVPIFERPETRKLDRCARTACAFFSYQIAVHEARICKEQRL